MLPLRANLTYSGLKSVGFASVMLLLTACQSLQESNQGVRMANQAAAKAARSENRTWQAPSLQGEATELSELIQDGGLDRLITQAIQANPDLQQVLLTLKFREGQLKQTDAAL